jgi:nitrate ABC transporter ATP-binding subunit
MSLVVRNVWKGFNGPRRADTPHWVLRDVSLTVAEGEFVSLIGHSGCGKSTLLRVIGGLTTADSGTVTLDAMPVTGPGADRAMVFQNYSLLPRLSLFDNVATAVRAVNRRRSAAEAGETAERYLTAVGLWPHHRKRPHEVSGGMQQRCAVARAFAVEPRVLLLDEPFGALDALTRAQLQEQLVDLWRSESATEIVIMVTHGVDEATLLSDRIVVLGNGHGPSIVEVLDVEGSRPRDPHTFLDRPDKRAVHDRLLALLRSDRSAFSDVVATPGTAGGATTAPASPTESDGAAA